MEGTNQEKRPKYWAELSDKEKIERMRKEVKWIEERLWNRIEGQGAIVDRLLHHSHGAYNGGLVVPLSSDLPGGRGRTKAFKAAQRGLENPDEVYF